MSPKKVHLVGSAPNARFSSPEEFFSYACYSLPHQLKRIPDGELGERHYYVNFQGYNFPPQVLRADNILGIPVAEASSSYLPRIEDFKDLGYADAAIASYAIFARMKAEGTVLAGVRFQVSLPHPFEAVGSFVAPEWQSRVAPIFEQKLLQELGKIQAAIPASELAVQWDVALVVGYIETSRGAEIVPYLRSIFTAWSKDGDGVGESAEDNQTRVWGSCMAALARVSSAMKPDVELGYHLCYGDIGHAHYYEPENLELLVKIANHLVETVQPMHNIAWIHMPVPKWVSDGSYFEALRELNLTSSTELYLGLVHYDDLEGSRKKVELAESVWSGRLGVAMECGMGRTPKEQLDGLFGICAALTGT